MPCPCCNPLPVVGSCCSGVQKSVPRSLTVQFALTGPFPNPPPYEFRNTLCPAGSGQSMFDGTYILPFDSASSSGGNGAAFYRLSLPTGVVISARWLCRYESTSLRTTAEIGIRYCRWSVPGTPRIGCYARVGTNQTWGFVFVDQSSEQASNLGSVAPPLCDIDIGQSLTVSGNTNQAYSNGRLCLYNGAACSFNLLNDYWDCYDVSVSMTPTW